MCKAPGKPGILILKLLIFWRKSANLTLLERGKLGILTRIFCGILHRHHSEALAKEPRAWRGNWAPDSMSGLVKSWARCLIYTIAACARLACRPCQKALTRAAFSKA
jgi:hypothetical protein